MSENKISRRKFLANAAALSSVLAVPSFIMGAGSSCSSPAPKKRDARIIGANGRVDMAMVGIGNRGKDVIKELDRIGVNTTIAKKTGIFGQTTMKKFREKDTSITLDNLNRLCAILEMQPRDIIKYVETEDDREKIISKIKE